MTPAVEIPRALACTLALCFALTHILVLAPTLILGLPPPSPRYAGAEIGTITTARQGTNGKFDSATLMTLASPVRALVADRTHLVVGCADGSISWFALDVVGMEQAEPVFQVSTIEAREHNLSSRREGGNRGRLSWSPVSSSRQRAPIPLS